MEVFHKDYCSRCGGKEELAQYNYRINKDGSKTVYYYCRPCNRERCKEWRNTGDNMKMSYKNCRRWSEKNPQKVRAYAKVRRAIKLGRLIPQPCFCGEVAQAHHEDYSKPLKVTWLCPQHHKARHAQMKKRQEIRPKLAS